MRYARGVLYVTLAYGGVAGGLVGAVIVAFAAAALVITEPQP